MPLKQPNKATQRIHFSYHAYVAGPMGDVFRYLLRNKALSTNDGKRMALAAISAFWKPFSTLALLDISENEAKVVAFHSIEELRRQIALIENTFNIQRDYTPLLNRQEIEQIIDSRLSQQGLSVQTASQLPRSIPIPDNYSKPAETYSRQA